MALIDERGRLFGRVNVIDAVVAIVLLGLVPLAYGAFLLFRVPTPVIVTTTPATVVAHQRGRIQITGADLRPFLRARFGTYPSPAFLAASPSAAEVEIPDLPPGTYDLVLSDQAQELAVKAGALTVTPPPPPPPAPQLIVQAVGSFTGLTAAEAMLLTAGMRFESPSAPAGALGELLAVRGAEPATIRVKTTPNVFMAAPARDLVRVPAAVRMFCSAVASDCKVGDVPITQGVELKLPWPAAAKSAEGAARSDVSFVIDELRPDGLAAPFPAAATIRVRFVTGPELLSLIRPGDVDVSAAGSVRTSPAAVLRDIGSDRQTIVGRVSNESFFRRSHSIDQTMVAFTGAVHVPLVWTPSGWSYNERPVKVGASFSFETMTGAMYGWIVDMKLDQEKTRP